MTREEAIEDLQLALSTGNYIFTKSRESLRMAISALSENKGEWIKIQSGDKDFPESIVCSKCKNENSHLDFDEHGEPIGKVFVTSNFCPNCGADMRPEPYKAESEDFPQAKDIEPTVESFKRTMDNVDKLMPEEKETDIGKAESEGK